MTIARDAILTAVACASLAAAPSFSQQADDLDADRVGPFDVAFLGAVDVLARAGDADPVRGGIYGDLDLDLELEAISARGLRWGVDLGARAQRGAGRRGFSRPVGDCPPAVAGCPAIAGRTPAGALTGLHAAPTLDPADARVVVDSASLFVKGGWGEVRVGRGPGAAALEAEAGPGAFRLMRADGPLADPTGLALVDTTNRLSGAAAKATARSRRLAGFRASASWTPDADWCGVDACRLGARAGVASPGIENVWEAALSFDRRFRSSGRRWTLSAGYAAGEANGPFVAAFEDPWAASARAALSAGPAAIGVSWLRSNDGVSGGDYEAWAVSASLERGAWLAAVEAGRGDSALLDARGWSVQAGASRYFESGLLLGFGAASARQTAPTAGPGGPVDATEKATLVFIETGWRF